jgi:hypothetical protein
MAHDWLEGQRPKASPSAKAVNNKLNATNNRSRCALFLCGGYDQKQIKDAPAFKFHTFARCLKKLSKTTANLVNKRQYLASLWIAQDARLNRSLE